MPALDWNHAKALTSEANDVNDFFDNLLKKAQVALDMKAKLERLDGQLPDLNQLAAIVDDARARGLIAPLPQSPAAVAADPNAAPPAAWKPENMLDLFSRGIAGVRECSPRGCGKYEGAAGLTSKAVANGIQVHVAGGPGYFGDVVTIFDFDARTHKMNATFRVESGEVKWTFAELLYDEGGNNEDWESIASRVRLNEYIQPMTWVDIEMWIDPNGTLRATFNGREAELSGHGRGMNRFAMVCDRKGTEILFREISFTER